MIILRVARKSLSLENGLDKGWYVPSLSKPFSSDRDFRATRPRYSTLCSLEEAYYEAPVQGKGGVSRLRFPSSQRVRNYGHGIHLDFSERRPETVRAEGSKSLPEQIHQETARRMVLPNLDC